MIRIQKGDKGAIRLKRLWVVALIILVCISWYLWEFQMWKTFESVSYIRDESSICDITIFYNAISGEKEKNTVDKDEILTILKYFSERKYKRIGNPPDEPGEVSNNDVHLIVFHADYGSGSRGIYPVILYPERDKILVDTKVYKINPPMNEIELREMYDKIDK